jgi:hypothetical protein
VGRTPSTWRRQAGLCSAKSPSTTRGASRRFPPLLRGNWLSKNFFWRGGGHRRSHVLRGRSAASRSRDRWRTTVSPFERHFRPGTAGRLTAVLAVLLLATLGGGLAAVMVASASDATSASEVAGTRPSPVTVTEKVVTTVVQAPETLTNVVTTTVQAAPVGPPRTQTNVSIDDAIALTDQSTYALGRGDWHEAERLARLAYPALVGTYSAANPYEAYVAFDLGDALAGQGQCGLALRYLARSEALQGPRDPITRAKAGCGY